MSYQPSYSHAISTVPITKDLLQQLSVKLQECSQLDAQPRCLPKKNVSRHVGLKLVTFIKREKESHLAIRAYLYQQNISLCLLAIRAQQRSLLVCLTKYSYYEKGAILMISRMKLIQHFLCFSVSHNPLGNKQSFQTAGSKSKPGSNPDLLQYGALFSLPSVLLLLPPPSFSGRDIQVAREQTLKQCPLLTAFKAKEQPGCLRSPLSLRQEEGMHLHVFFLTRQLSHQNTLLHVIRSFVSLGNTLFQKHFKELNTYLPR